MRPYVKEFHQFFKRLGKMKVSVVTKLSLYTMQKYPDICLEFWPLRVAVKFGSFIGMLVGIVIHEIQVGTVNGSLLRFNTQHDTLISFRLNKSTNLGILTLSSENLT